MRDKEEINLFKVLKIAHRIIKEDLESHLVQSFFILKLKTQGPGDPDTPGVELGR